MTIILRMTDIEAFQKIVLNLRAGEEKARSDARRYRATVTHYSHGDLTYSLDNNLFSSKRISQGGAMHRPGAAPHHPGGAIHRPRAAPHCTG